MFLFALGVRYAEVDQYVVRFEGCPWHHHLDVQCDRVDFGSAFTLQVQRELEISYLQGCRLVTQCRENVDEFHFSS